MPEDSEQAYRSGKQMGILQAEINALNKDQVDNKKQFERIWDKLDQINLKLAAIMAIGGFVGYLMGIFFK